jgi:hypothetical protein
LCWITKVLVMCFLMPASMRKKVFSDLILPGKNTDVP